MGLNILDVWENNGDKQIVHIVKEYDTLNKIIINNHIYIEPHIYHIIYLSYHIMKIQYVYIYTHTHAYTVYS